MCSSKRLQTGLCTFYAIFRNVPNETERKNKHQRLSHSPLWIRRCSFRWCLYLKALPHSVHLNLRLPAPWVSIWCYKRRKTDISFVQEEQRKFVTNIFKRLLFSDRPKGLSACLFICPVFQSCNKSDNVGNKIGTNKKKSAFTCASNTCFRIISVVSFPKCFFEPLEMRKHNCKDVCGSLCLLQILKSEDSLLERNDFVKEKNKYYTQNSSLPEELPTHTTHFLFSVLR